MTGIVGIATTTHQPDLGVKLQHGCGTILRQPWYRENEHLAGDGRFGVATVYHDFSVAGTTQPNESGGSLTIFGDLYDLPVSGDCYRVLSEMIQADAWHQFNDVQGAFVATSYDESSGILHIVNDQFAQRPLYYHEIDGVLRFSTSLPALFEMGVPSVLAASGVSQFFSFGQYLGCDTLYRDIQILPAGAILRFDTNDGSYEVRTYRSASQPTNYDSDKAWLDAICDATVSAVVRASRDTNGLGVALSGGLDARTILGLIDHDSVELKSICLGMPGSMDLQCAERMAEIVGCQHHSHLLDHSFLQSFESHLNRMVDLTGGQYLSQCIVMPTLPVYPKQGIKVLLRGHAGELMHMGKAYAYSLDEQALGISTRAAASEWLFDHMRAYMLDGVDGELFRGEFASAMRAAPRDAFDQAFHEIPELDDPRNAIWYSFVKDRLRRETTLSLGKFASVCDVRVPLLDRELVELLLAAPVHLKQDETIQRHILKRCRPELLSVVNANIGAPMNAGPVMQKLGNLRMRVLSKLGVRGYQPYERLGLWLRRELEPLVQQILLDEECLDRGVFNPDVVRRVIENHKLRAANHTYLILAMMIFEVGQRRVCRSAETVA